ncbi:hypothetical protein FBEOM_13254 [Fusarium beomiforme]|uniref:VWFA domain-containing protein n=1 Tax=Fusarium beomiforme TaxID=44412 RepID=A0A9P5DNZ6_9HYPO|nr:hypothetical protein FBEOM_13254 [Fusarium beomiforme]
MASVSPTPAVVGCLLDVSGSMHETLESGQGDGRAVERLRAVLRAAVKLARAEQQHSPDALLFVGVFGLDTRKGAPASIDLCNAIEGLVAVDSGQNAHELLIQLANRRGRSHITKYIRTKLKEHEARIIHNYLMRNPTMINKFANAIPSSFSATVGINAAEGVGDFAESFGFGFINETIDRSADNSDAMVMARKILNDWLNEFQHFAPRKIESVIHLLEQIDQSLNPYSHSTSGGESTLLDSLRHHMYGSTPMRHSLEKASQVFRSYPARQQALVMISDGQSTDGDPLSLVQELHAMDVTLATIFLTNRASEAQKSLYDQQMPHWDVGQRTLFDMSTRVHGSTHPIPVMVSTGWRVPSSGECRLYTTVCSTDALEEFCSLLLSARFGSADIFLDVFGKVNLDSFVNDKHVITCNNPSDQGNEGVCYAHAVATVTHMALVRIVDREGGCPSIETIRDRILQQFPPREGGWPTSKVLEKVVEWYRPLKFKIVDENGARQAVLRRRPVAATFRLSESGWEMFGRHFDGHSGQTGGNMDAKVLTVADMRPHRRGKDGGGHAVVLTRCDPESLTFINSWGRDWGNNGSFSVQDARVLELELDHGRTTPLRFYDIYWLESDLTQGERAAYHCKADKDLQSQAGQHPSILSLEAACPYCTVASPLVSFTGSIRSAVCPRCHRSFTPEPGHLLQALYVQAGFGESL